MCEVAATVVAPATPRASAGARSRTPHLTTPSVSASASSAAASSPTRTEPASSAIVAGTAPPARTAASISRATRRLSGRGSPWAMIVLSSATTGRPASSAACTSGSTRTGRRLWQDGLGDPRRQRRPQRLVVRGRGGAKPARDDRKALVLQVHCETAKPYPGQRQPRLPLAVLEHPLRHPVGDVV